jgi:hypothetical protein
MARKRLAAIAERKEKAGRLGFGVRAPGPLPAPSIGEPEPPPADPTPPDPAEPSEPEPAPVGPTETGESGRTGDSAGPGTGT